MNDWQTAQEWEATWWGSCQNTFGEEYKQLLYANRMGLHFFHDGKSPYNIDLFGASVLDVGGGPVSLLLKCVNGHGKVIEPLVLPDWVLARYDLAGIEVERMPAESMTERDWDECWIYNVLQHVQDPKQVIYKARQAAKLIRLFEWIDTPTNEGHPFSLTERSLNEWLDGEGRTETLNGQNTCTGRAYYGIFPV